MEGNAEVCGRRRHLRRMYRRPGGLAVLLAPAAFALAACSGGSGTSQVASLGISSGWGTGSGSGRGSGAGGGSVPAAQPAAVTPLLTVRGACERSNRLARSDHFSTAAAAVQRRQKAGGLCGS
jgi:hypothetical protein